MFVECALAILPSKSFLRVATLNRATVLSLEQMPIVGRHLTFMNWMGGGKGAGGGGHPDEIRPKDLASARCAG